MVEEQKFVEKKKSCKVFFMVLMNMSAKHPSNREKLQRQKVKYGRRTKDSREGKNLLPFLYFIVLMNLRAKHSSNREKLQRKIVKYDRRTKSHIERKKLLPFQCFSQCS